MSGWTIITVRGKENEEYENSEWDNTVREDAQKDIAASFEEDNRVAQWTTWRNGHVYALLNTGRYDFNFAEELFEDYEGIIDDAVVLGWNDTSDTGMARYYDRPELGRSVMEYEENEPNYGRRACAVMTAQFGILARDPFTSVDETGYYDERYTELGEVQEQVLPETRE